MIVENLVHADGTTLKNSDQHRWSINTLPPGKDFYNWMDRCKSAGPIYDPYKVLILILNSYKHIDAMFLYICLLTIFEIR